METNTPNLTTATDILEAYLQNFEAHPAYKKGAVKIDSDEFHRIIKTKTIRESVTACISKEQFDMAVVFLDSEYHRNKLGSPKDRELAQLGMEMAEVCLGKNKLNFVEWALNRAYEIYPLGSPERHKVIERGVSLVNNFTGPDGSLFFAEVILLRSLEIYPEGSDERRQAIAKQEAIAKRRQASYALGNRRNTPKCIAKPPVPRNKLGDMAVAG